MHAGEGRREGEVLSASSEGRKRILLDVMLIRIGKCRLGVREGDRENSRDINYYNFEFRVRTSLQKFKQKIRGEQKSGTLRTVHVCMSQRHTHTHKHRDDAPRSSEERDKKKEPTRYHVKFTKHQNEHLTLYR